AENGMLAIDAFECRTARTGIALVTRPGGLAEIFAAGALQNIAAEAGHVADLLTGSQLEALRDHGIMLFDRRVVLRLPHAHECPQSQAFLRCLDAPIALAREAVNVDQPFRLHDI